jgi:hypothetical protein
MGGIENTENARKWWEMAAVDYFSFKTQIRGIGTDGWT